MTISRERDQPEARDAKPQSEAERVQDCAHHHYHLDISICVEGPEQPCDIIRNSLNHFPFSDSSRRLIISDSAPVLQTHPNAWI
ncbi:hypothetical protein GN956_G15767 [Arapaima gigas]